MKDLRAGLPGVEHAGFREGVETTDLAVSSLRVQAVVEQNGRVADKLLASWALVPTSLQWGLAPVTEECSACKRIVMEVCGENFIQQSWFRTTPCRGLCFEHR